MATENTSRNLSKIVPFQLEPDIQNLLMNCVFRDIDLVKTHKILVAGRVQGVGFRPAVYGIAHQLGLSGFVHNDTKGVTIELQCDFSR